MISSSCKTVLENKKQKGTHTRALGRTIITVTGLAVQSIYLPTFFFFTETIFYSVFSYWSGDCFSFSSSEKGLLAWREDELM